MVADGSGADTGIEPELTRFEVDQLRRRKINGYRQEDFFYRPTG